MNGGEIRRQEPAGGIVRLIQERAYQRYQQRGRQPGHELGDWLKAERDVCPREALHPSE